MTLFQRLIKLSANNLPSSIFKILHRINISLGLAYMRSESCQRSSFTKEKKKRQQQLEGSKSPHPGSPDPGTPAAHPGPLVIRGKRQALTQTTQQTEGTGKQSQLKGDFKMMVEINVNKERYFSNLI